MKLGVILNTNDPETAWNALRLGNTALDARHEVSVFLMGSGVEVEDIKSEKFNMAEVLSKFIGSKGNLLTCGTCLKVRQRVASLIGAAPDEVIFTKTRPNASRTI